MTQEEINEVMANSMKNHQLRSVAFDGENIEAAKRMIDRLESEIARLTALLPKDAK